MDTAIWNIHSGWQYVLLVTVMISLFFMTVAPRERRTLIKTLACFILAILGIVFSNVLSTEGFKDAPRYIRGGSNLIEGFALISLAGTAIYRIILPGLNAARPRIFQDVSVAFASAVWLLVSLHQAGVDLNGLVATSAVISAAVAFSAQDTLGNILGGMVVQFDRSFEIGDWIRSDDVIGKVTDIRWRHTVIETRNWETVVIPNSTLIKQKVFVLGRRQNEPLQWRRWVYFNIEVQYAPSSVIQAVEKALRSAEIPNISKAPPPDCIHMDFINGDGRYAVRYFLLDLAKDDSTDSEVRSRIFYALRRAGIPIATPSTGVVLTQNTAESKAIQLETELTHRIHALQHVDVFGKLTPEELRRLAEKLVPAPFSRGDVITNQGAEAHWLYMIINGRADVVVQTPSGQSARVAELGPGNFFGEMSLLTGEPRSATILARTDVECYRLDKDSFKEIITERPAMAQELSRLAAGYRTGLKTAVENLNAEEQERLLALENESILDKIRRLFGLAA